MKSYNPLDWIYDLECYPNIFTAALKHSNTGTRRFFEISQWRNDLNEFIEFLHALSETNCRMIGFSNQGYDYPLIHYIINNCGFNLTYQDIYRKSAELIATPWDRRFDNVIWQNNEHITQIDLYKIHHFDNEARSTGLKMLEFAMRADNIQDLPFEPGFPITFDQRAILIQYNIYGDVDNTEQFYYHSIEMIEFREQLGEKYDKSFLNHNDKKIGTDLFIDELEKAAPGSCYIRENGKRKPRQTHRDFIKLSDVVFPYIEFKNPGFKKVLQWFKGRVINEIKGGEKYEINIQGLEYVFRLGGIHASIDSATICSNDEYEIIDWDVAGYYPEVGTANKLFPAHLSTIFCDVNEKLKEIRKEYIKLHGKKSALSTSIKLARNGAFGDSNMMYSPFFDPQYTVSITVNGQLLLCIAIQHLLEIPGLQVIQANTDGFTVRCPRKYITTMNKICEWWEQFTCLELEKASYKRMFIRDVNNYIGEFEDGKLKRKGAYAYETPMENLNTQEVLWHKNHSMLVVPKAAEAALVHGQCIEDFIINHVDIFDFMLVVKVGKSDQLVSVHNDQDYKQQRITRYYVSNSPSAGSLVKISPPANGKKVGGWKRKNSLTDAYYHSVINELKTATQDDWLAANYDDEFDVDNLPWDERINTKNRSKYKIRRTGIESGWLVKTCNNIKDADRNDINYAYYIAEVKKLVDPLRGN